MLIFAGAGQMARAGVAESRRADSKVLQLDRDFILDVFGFIPLYY